MSAVGIKRTLLENEIVSAMPHKAELLITECRLPICRFQNFTGSQAEPAALAYRFARRCRDCDRCSYVSLQLIFCNGAVEGLTAALYSVLELSIPLRKLSNYVVWTRRSLSRGIALAEPHHVPGNESMPGTFMFVQLAHVLSLA